MNQKDELIEKIKVALALAEYGNVNMVVKTEEARRLLEYIKELERELEEWRIGKIERII